MSVRFFLLWDVNVCLGEKGLRKCRWHIRPDTRSKYWFIKLHSADCTQPQMHLNILLDPVKRNLRSAATARNIAVTSCSRIWFIYSSFCRTCETCEGAHIKSKSRGGCVQINMQRQHLTWTSHIYTYKEHNACTLKGDILNSSTQVEADIFGADMRITLPTEEGLMIS